MVCPYCSHKNPPVAVTCHQCGVLRKLGKTGRPASHSGGGLSFVRGILPGRLKGQHAALLHRRDELTKEIQEKAESDLKIADEAPAARLRLAVSYLLQNEIEKSLHWFLQAKQMGASDVEYFNNVAVALAQRGTLPQAVEMLTRAAEMTARTAASSVPSAAPAANLARLFTQAGGDPDPSGAASVLKELRRAVTWDPKNPTLYSRLGLVLCREDRCEEAVPQFRQALALAAGNPSIQADAQTNIGYALCRFGDLPGACSAWEAALQLEPSHARALCNHVLMQMQKMQNSAGAPELDKLARAVHLDSSDAAVRANSGYGLCRAGAINDGILALKDAIESNSHLFEACYNLGKAYADHDALNSAERYVSRALQFSPRSPEALTALGVIKTKQKLVAPAVQHFQSVLRLWPRSALACTNLAVALGLSNNFTEAALHLRKAAELCPKDAQIPAQVGWLHLRRESLTEGMQELGIALKRDDHIPEVHNNYGVCYVSLGKPDLALPHFARALELHPDFHAVHYQWGYAHHLLKNETAAMREWDLSAHLEPGNADCHANRGFVFYQRGQMDDAITEFRLVIGLRQTRMEDFSNLGLAYAKAGLLQRAAARNAQDPRLKTAVERHKQAIDMFDKALSLDKRNVMLHSNRGLACFFASRPEEAMKEWGLVSQIDPAYARRRGQRQQSEFDDSRIALVPFSVPDRAAPIAPRTAGYLPHYLSGYDTEEWDLILPDPALTRLAELRRDLRRLDRALAAQGGK